MEGQTARPTAPPCCPPTHSSPHRGGVGRPTDADRRGSAEDRIGQWEGGEEARKDRDEEKDTLRG